jgi:hypothetical protein
MNKIASVFAKKCKNRQNKWLCEIDHRVKKKKHCPMFMLKGEQVDVGIV